MKIKTYNLKIAFYDNSNHLQYATFTNISRKAVEYYKEYYRENYVVKALNVR